MRYTGRPTAQRQIRQFRSSALLPTGAHQKRDKSRIPNYKTYRSVKTLSKGEEFWGCLMAAESGFTCPQTLKSIIKNGDLQRAAALNVVLPCELFVLPCEQPQQLGTSPQFRACRRGRLSSAQGVCPSRRCNMQKASSLRCTSVTSVI